MKEDTLENTLARLLSVGTLICSSILSVGILLDVAAISLAKVDLVAIGILGFILLPILRLILMLASYLTNRDMPLSKVVFTVLSLVVISACVGVFW